MIVALTCLVAPLGCGDDGSGEADGSTSDATMGSMSNPTGDASTGEPTTGGEETGMAVDYVADIQPIWDEFCVTGCHTPGGLANDTGPYLDPGASYAALIDVMSPTLPTYVFVSAGDSSKSYLWHKVNDTFQQIGGSGVKMPLGGSLSADQLALIKAWIDGGAMP